MTDFEKYQKLIRKRCWQYHKQYKGKIEYEEIEAQGYLLYCEALENYDITKSNFSTHLWWKLGFLDSWCKTIVRRTEKNTEINENNFYVNSEYDEYKLDFEDFIYNLSEKATKVVKWILSREWEDFHKTKPTIKMACEKFNCSYPTMKNIYNEIEKVFNTI